MVLQMQSAGYRSEFRPFGMDPALVLPGGPTGRQLMVVTEATKSWPLPAASVGGRGHAFRLVGPAKSWFDFLKREP